MASSSSIGIVAAINVSRGGVPKERVFKALVDETGVDGDRQRDRRFHGGPDRAVVLFSLDVIHSLQHEGHPIGTGTTGENLTISGIEWPRIVPGVELQAGEARLLITKYASPCEKIRRSFLQEDFSRVSQSLYPGWSRVCARVLSSGIVKVNDSVEVLGR